jgi:cytoskeletal protein CcmA (bactofilin family)
MGAPASATGSVSGATPSSRTPAADNGLGIPPVRPATPATTKENPMGRAPFPAAPPAPGQTPAAGSAPGAVPNRVPGAPPAPGAPGAARPNKDVAERRTLVVGRGISVQGTVQDAERLVVEGTVEASMIHAAELSVAPGGVFRGAIEVQDAELAGTIDGTLTANGALVIRSTGRLIGTARCRRLQVEDGGQVSGKLEMLTDAPRTTPLGEPLQSSKPAPTPQPAVEPAPAETP